MFLAAGCSESSNVSAPTTIAGASARAPEGFTAVTLLVTTADGSVVEWCVWLADDGPSGRVVSWR